MSIARITVEIDGLSVKRLIGRFGLLREIQLMNLQSIALFDDQLEILQTGESTTTGKELLLLERAFARH